MKKFSFAMVTVYALAMIVLPVAASTSDQELANLLNDLQGSEGDTATQQPAAEADHNAAEAILDTMDSDKWAYAGPEKIEVKDVTATGAVIMTTQVNYDGTGVAKYKIYYSDKTLATVQDFSKITQVVVDVDETKDNVVSLKFENLEANKTYYIVVAPVHPTDATQEPLSFISDEVMFTTKAAVAAEDTSSIKVFENVSYTYKDSTVSLTWTPSSAAKTAEINLRHQAESTYTKVGTPMLNDGKFSFAVSKAGTYFLKLVALDEAGNPVGQEHIQTIKIDTVEEPETVVQAAPQVGPTTNIMIGLMIFAVLGYFVLRFRRIER